MNNINCNSCSFSIITYYQIKKKDSYITKSNSIINLRENGVPPFAHILKRA